MIREILRAMIEMPLRIAFVALGAWVGVMAGFAPMALIPGSSVWLWDHGISIGASETLPFLAILWVLFATLGAGGFTLVWRLVCSRIVRRATTRLEGEGRT